jgi:predicted transcriptional regulator
MNLELTRPRNRWQDKVREEGRIVDREEWQEKVCNRGMEEAPENGKELSHSAHANGMNG